MEDSRTTGLVASIPNFITAIGLGLALISIFFTLHGHLDKAAWMIALCVLFDKADGAAARLLKADSAMGVQLDSLADFVSFCISPALLAAALLTASGAPFDGFPGAVVAYASCIVFVVAGAARLARFNVCTSDGQLPKKYFIGVPTTTCGATVAVGYLTVAKYLDLPQYAFLVPAVLLLLAILMVSPLYLPKMGTRNRSWINWFQIANFAVVPVLVLLQVFPEYLAFLIFIYLAVGLTYSNRKAAVIE